MLNTQTIIRKECDMRYLQLILLLLSAVFTQKQIEGKSLGERFRDAKDSVVGYVSRRLAYLGGTTKEDRLARLAFYQQLLESVKKGKYLSKWQLYIKRWYVWIIDGRMPAKDPDGQISDIAFMPYVIKVEELMRGTELTQDEKEFLCRKAMKELERYRKEKGIRA